MKQCERCLKTTDGIHTCTPTDFVRELEAERDKYRKALEDCYQYHQFESAFITRNEVRNILIEALK